jgi:hypothetical protein
MCKLTSARCRALALMPVLIFSGALSAQERIGHAVAPRAASTAEITRLAQDYRKLYFQKNAATPAGALRDRATYARWVELRWRLSRTMDERKTLGDLSELGLTIQDNGGYTVQLNEHPYWASEVEYLLSLRSSGVSDIVAADLKKRSFSDADLAVLKNYLETHHPELGALGASKALSEQFANKVRTARVKKTSVAREDITNFVYQRALALEESRRLWAVGLLDVLDETRQEALIEHIAVQTGVMVLGPGSDVDTLQKELLAMFESGQYETLWEQEDRETQK